MRHSKLLVLALIMTICGTSFAYSDIPDPYQNGSSNVSYDLSSKFYIGGNIGYGIFSESDAVISNNKIGLSSSPLDFGLFGGYKINDNFAIEGNFQRLGKLSSDSSSLLYKTIIYNLSADAIVSYPVTSNYHYTVSVYGKGGYGINFARYDYNYNSGSSGDSGGANHGAYNFGLGVNVDFRSNVSVRADYTYYQANYPLPENGSNHNYHLFSIGLYYNFN